MLFDGALRFASLARAAIEANQPEQTYEGVTRCQAILLELINSLQSEHDPELCSNLSALYTFMYTRLMEACNQRSTDIVDEVISLLQYERETWLLLMEKLAAENASAAAAFPTGTADAPNSGISVQG